MIILLFLLRLVLPVVLLIILGEIFNRSDTHYGDGSDLNQTNQRITPSGAGDYDVASMSA